MTEINILKLQPELPYCHPYENEADIVAIKANHKTERRRAAIKRAGNMLTTTCIFAIALFPSICEAWATTTSKRLSDTLLMTLSADLKMQDPNSLSMLLNNIRLPSTSVLVSSENTIGKRDIINQIPGHKEERKNGGTLGFDIFTACASQSPVDLDVWSGSRDLDSFSPNSGIVWNSNAQKDVPTSMSLRLRQNILPAWFPWIPTKSQIESLRVSELKEACSQRGLVKMGKKAALQERLWKWTIERQQEHQAKINGDFLTNWFEEDKGTIEVDTGAVKGGNGFAGKATTRTWQESVDLDSLREKRKEIHRQKRQGRPSPKISTKSEQSPKEYLRQLQKTLQTPSSPLSSNVKSKELYLASKRADQLGDRKTAVELLQTLLRVTPNDGRVYRRLSRMFSEQGNFHDARAILQLGIRRQPENPWLWHGLAQLEQQYGDDKHRVRQFYQKAIQLDPSFANAYHAWGTFEHNEGNIAKAMKILKKGIEFCPTNHRLHHALGDLYRGAKLLEDAERSYRRALEHGSPVNYCFAYSALACVAYERDQIPMARKWLQRSLQLNNGRHSQGWVSLAQLEECQGNIEEARAVCKTAIAQYERGLIEARQRYRKQATNQENADDFTKMPNELSMITSLDTKNRLLQSVPKHRSGDKFLNVYRSWARLEEKYGNFDSVDEVYSRACVAFPLAYKLQMDWGSYHAKMHNYDRARRLYSEACNKGGSSDAEPYRLFAELEMSRGNFREARTILFRGAQSVSKSDDGGLRTNMELAKLFHTWALCEWHLRNLPRAEVLLDHALRMTDKGDAGRELRSFILYSIARLELYQGKDMLAQHCIALCLKEDGLPGGNMVAWKLWEVVAKTMGNANLEDECRQQAEKCKNIEKGSSSRVSSDSVQDIQKFSLRREPWQVKLFGLETTDRATAMKFFRDAPFPSLPTDDKTTSLKMAWT